MAKQTTKENGPKFYLAYRFRSKDPAIDAWRTVAQEYFGKRNLAKADYKQAEELGGPSWSTMRQWLEGKTMRPQNATLEAAGRALGYERVWRRRGRNNGSE